MQKKLTRKERIFLNAAILKRQAELKQQQPKFKKKPFRLEAVSEIILFKGK